MNHQVEKGLINLESKTKWNYGISEKFYIIEDKYEPFSCQETSTNFIPVDPIIPSRKKNIISNKSYLLQQKLSLEKEIIQMYK